MPDNFYDCLSVHSSPSLVVRDLKLALSSPSPYARTSRVKLLLRLARAHESCRDADGAKETVAELKRMAKELKIEGNVKEKVTATHLFLEGFQDSICRPYFSIKLGM